MIKAARQSHPHATGVGHISFAAWGKPKELPASDGWRKGRSYLSFERLPETSFRYPRITESNSPDCAIIPPRLG